MTPAETNLPDLPEDSASLKQMLRALLAERDREKQRASLIIGPQENVAFLKLRKQ